MEKTNKELRREAALKRLKESIDPAFKKPSSFMVPFKKSVIINKVGNTESMQTEGGIIIPDTVTRKSMVPNIGIIYAVGIDCEEYLQEGMKVSFSEYADLEILIAGKPYFMVHEDNVYGAMPDKTFARMSPKNDKEIVREDALNREIDFLPKNKLRNDNQMDQLEEIAKKNKKRTIN